MVGTTCIKDEQTRIVAAFVECTVLSQKQTLNKQVHKYGYIFKLYLEGNKHLVRKENKRVDLEEVRGELEAWGEGGTSLGLGMQGLGGSLIDFCVLCQVQWETINGLKAGSGMVKELNEGVCKSDYTHDIRAG